MRQEYQKEDMFPVKCWAFNSPKGMAEDTLAKVKELEFRNYTPFSVFSFFSIYIYILNQLHSMC